MEHRRQEYECVIDEWVLNERDRIALKRKYLDGIPYEAIADHRTAFIEELPAGGSFFAPFLPGICRKDAPGFPRKTGPLLA